MKKVSLAVLLMGTCLACFGLSVAKEPILFKGLDEVPFTSICTSDSMPNILIKSIMACALNMDEYAGEKLIKRSKSDNGDVPFYYNYSHAEYDLVTKKIINLHFVMRQGALDRVKEVLEAKYGKAQTDGTSPSVFYWYGDKDGSTFVYLTEKQLSGKNLGDLSAGRATILVIITKAMRNAEYEMSARNARVYRENKERAIKGL